ncbi:uncharacterized protein BJ171DRAFT_485127 [Polychytrium aggregatum]|uniref:uncharacterized protein n=1 Tax=Polychytrium aggregatum TaxID=110093 RepID=UPI0022FEF566|nr:uncharacterized protein BJ171DRAFT_485127 [Polychytrium aggregatum]KAI9209822.1 hypothetical protein BJ171DRAFT_485127 [Polychytrium aggregatum]
MGCIKNFFVIHKSGKIYFSRNFHGDSLDSNLVVGFSSSVSNFCKTLLGENIREIVSLKGRIIYKEVGDFMFIAHSDLQTGSTAIQSILRDVVGLCEFLFGSHDYWDEDFFDLKGAQDIVTMLFTKAIQDPSTIVNGISQIFLEPEIIERIDKLLSFLESHDGVCGNGTMLILGDAVLHSRFELHDTRMILQYHKARPLGGNAVRYTPAFCSGSWHNLYIVRVQAYVLVLMAYIDKPYSSLQKRIDDFRISFAQSRLEIPTEEPPLLLRLFAKRETLAMLYQNIKNGCTIFPQLRPGPDVQQKEIFSTFWSFFSDASASMKVPGITEFGICRDQYRFYARSEGVHKLYILLSTESVNANSVAGIATDILKSVRAHIKVN